MAWLLAALGSAGSAVAGAAGTAASAIGSAAGAAGSAIGSAAGAVGSGIGGLASEIGAAIGSSGPGVGGAAAPAGGSGAVGGALNAAKASAMANPGSYAAGGAAGGLPTWAKAAGAVGGGGGGGAGGNPFSIDYGTAQAKPIDTSMTTIGPSPSHGIGKTKSLPGMTSQNAGGVAQGMTKSLGQQALDYGKSELLGKVAKPYAMYDSIANFGEAWKDNPFQAVDDAVSAFQPSGLAARERERTAELYKSLFPFGAT